MPITVSVDPLDFFQGSAQGLFDLARSLFAQGGPPTQVTVRATPTVDAALGPIR